MVSLAPTELLKVLKVASASKRNHCMILFAFRFGMRASEVCDLRLSDIDRKNGTITVRRLKGSKTSVAHMTNVQGQPLLSVIRVLNAWLDERQIWQDASDYVFVSQKGGGLDRSAFFRMFQAVATEAGLPGEKRHPHDRLTDIPDRMAFLGGFDDLIPGMLVARPKYVSSRNGLVQQGPRFLSLL